MNCPKCQGPMQTFERHGVHVEQCGECKGIFLDRGELEQIVSAEQQYHAAAPPPLDLGSGSGQTPPPPQRQQPPPQYYRDSPSHYRGYKDSPGPYGYGRKRRRRSLLEELFD